MIGRDGFVWRSGEHGKTFAGVGFEFNTPQASNAKCFPVGWSEFDAFLRERAGED